MTTLRVDRHGPVQVLTLTRPEKRNALNAALRDAMVDALAAASADDSVGAVVVTGAGGEFCAGFDLDELAAGDPSKVFGHAVTYHHAVHTFAKPVIAAVEGRAVAGGFDLALMCDLRVAGTTARFGQPQVRRGIPAAYELVRAVVGDAVARDLCLTGRLLDATEALRLGVVHRVVPDPLDEAIRTAQDIAASPGSAAAKRQFLAAQPDVFSGP